jgi:hypothetical protein
MLNENILNQNIDNDDNDEIEIDPSELIIIADSHNWKPPKELILAYASQLGFDIESDPPEMLSIAEKYLTKDIPNEYCRAFYKKTLQLVYINQITKEIELNSEFEELAKKRGYSKKSDDDERKKAEDDAKRRVEAINNIPKPKELDADTWSAMPPMNKIIYSRLPYVTAHGKDGDVKIKAPNQLPDDFEFANDKARAQYTNDIQAQENMAQQMANYIQMQARQQRESVQQREQARSIIAEVNELQKSGDLPIPKAKPNTPEFETDPDVAIINKVLNYQALRAKQGVNLSVRDAYLLCRAEHPNDFKKPETKAKGDDERKTIAKKVAGNNKSTNKSAAEESAGNKRKYYRPGMSTQDVLDRALQDLD